MKSVSFLVGTCLFLATSVGTAAETKLTVAMLRSLSQAPVWVALESGFYKQQELGIVPVQFSSGPQSIMALISGDVQMTTTGGAAAINAKLKGGDTVLIGTLVGVYPYVFYASGRIRNPEDLKGKKVGISSFGGASHTATQIALQKLGLNPKTDVTMVQIGDQGSRLAAMASGSIDGTLMQPPESLRAREMKFKPMVNLAQSGVKFPLDHLATSRKYVENNRETTKKFMRATIAGIARFKSDRNFTMEVLKKYLGLSDPRLLAETYDFWAPIYPAKPYVDPGELEAYLPTVADRGSARAEDFFDNSIVAELDHEGFIAGVYRKYEK